MSSSKRINTKEASSSTSLNIISYVAIQVGKLHKESRLHAASSTTVGGEHHRGCCSKCNYCCRCCTAPCLTENHPLSTNPSFCERCKYAFLCPPHGTLATVWSFFILLLFLWIFLWGISEKQALPGGIYFSLLVLIVFCIICGEISNKFKAPNLIGMLIGGILLRNVPVVNVAKDIDSYWSGVLRATALVVILTRAGLSLDPAALKSLSCAVIRLAAIPCLVEASAIGVAAHLILDFPWPWAFMLGFVMAAVSPAIVVLSMLRLEEQEYGKVKGVPTLIIAAASIDDVVAISGFGFLLGYTFATGNLAFTVIRGPLEALLGAVYGLVVGVMLWYIPSQDYVNKVAVRTFLLFLGGLAATFGSRHLEIHSAGALGVLTLAFVSVVGWRKRLTNEEICAIGYYMQILWMILEPLLFGLIGAEFNVEAIKPETIGYGLAVLFCGLVFRSISAFGVVFGLGLTIKEKLFVPIAWLPKATVQAAIGSVALDTVRAQPQLDPYLEDLGFQVLTVAILGIIVTAPIGAIAIGLLGPKMLEKGERKDFSGTEVVDNSKSSVSVSEFENFSVMTDNIK